MFMHTTCPYKSSVMTLYVCVCVRALIYIHIYIHIFAISRRDSGAIKALLRRYYIYMRINMRVCMRVCRMKLLMRGIWR